ncbi:hypothetical protein UlMin_017887 [Ulmus minor]
MEREKCNRNGIGGYSEFCCDYDDQRLDHINGNGRSPTSSMPSSSALLPVSSTPLPPSSPTSAFGYIEHPVSRLDTLAGVAIKYGVEVADIKKINGLVSDLQMFALKSLQIPLPGRHPPSPCFSNGSNTSGQSSSDRTPPNRLNRDLFESFPSLQGKSPRRRVSPAMSSLQGYYGLRTDRRSSTSEAIELAVYRDGVANYLEDGPLPRVSSPTLSIHQKSSSLVNGFSSHNGELTDTKEGNSARRSEKLTRRRQKSEADFSHTPEMLLEDNSGSSGFSAIAGKHLALRTKVASRTNLATDVENGGLNFSAFGSGDSLVAGNGFNGVRKSLSTPSLQDSDYNSCMSIWSSSKWNLKAEMPAFSTANIAKPIFDGLPKPITGRRSKAALD